MSQGNKITCNSFDVSFSKTSEGGSAIGQDTQRGGYSLRPKTEFVLPSFRGIRTSSLTLPSHSLLPKKASQDYPSFRLAAKARKTCAERVESFRTLNKIARPDMTMCSARTDLLVSYNAPFSTFLKNLTEYSWCFLFFFRGRKRCECSGEDSLCGLIDATKYLSKRFSLTGCNISGSKSEVLV